ncbi:MAG TPA: sialidase family protein [bacterium]|jgi:hypothetical protein
MRTGRLAIVVLLIGLAVAWPARGAGVAAYTPVNISHNAGNSFYPSLGLNGTTLIAVWTDDTGSSNTEVFLARSLDTGVTWGAAVNVSNTNTASSEQYDWAFAGRFLYIVWKDQSPGNDDILYRRSTDGGATFLPALSSPATNLSGNAGVSQLPRVAVEGGNVYVAWEDQTPLNKEIFFRRSGDGGASFGTAKNLSNTLGVSASPQLVAFGPHVFVLWEEETSLGHPDLLMRHSTDGGSTFAAAVNVSNDGDSSFLGGAAFAGQHVYAVYQNAGGGGGGDIYGRLSGNGGASFGAGTNISNNAGYSYAPRVMMTGTFVYVLWTDDTPGNYDIFFRRSLDAGATWAAAINLSNNAGASIGIRASWAMAGTVLHVAWPDQTPGNYDILYRRSTNSGGSFVASVNLSANGGVSDFPQVLAVGRDAFVVWHDSTPGNYDILFLRTTTGGFSMPIGADGPAWPGESANPATPQWCGADSPAACRP